MRLLFTWLYVGLFAFSAVAQSLTISGAVTDNVSHEPMPGVLVTLRPSGENKVVKFAQTSANGTFEIKLTDFP